MSPNIEPVMVQSVELPLIDQLPDLICANAESEIEDIIDELDYDSIFGADQYLTTVERTLAYADLGLRECQNCGYHLFTVEMAFDPIAGSGTVKLYIDGDHIATENITWADIAECRLPE